MTVEELLSDVDGKELLPPGLALRAVKGIAYNSRRVEAGFLFWAFAGEKADGRDFAVQAMEKGALAVVSDLPKPEVFEGPWIMVPHGRRALALAARRFYGFPDERLQLTGITGTNGKTTTCHLIDSICVPPAK